MNNINKVCFIINPIAGGRKKDGLEKYLNQFLTRTQWETKILYTRYPSHAYEYARLETKGDTDLIVAVGGDGTINEVARAVADSGKILGIVPHGSGNGFARHFGIPLNYKKALEGLLENSPRRIDVGCMNGQDFFCTSGTGFDAETGYHFRNFEKRGFFSYMFSFLKVFLQYAPGRYQLIIDGKPLETEAFFINVANISQFGYHFYVAPEASATDGLLDLIVVRKFPKWKAPVLVLRSFFGHIHKSPYVMHFKAKEIKIRKGNTGRIMHIDGESEFLDEEMNYSLKAGVLSVIIPEEK